MKTNIFGSLTAMHMLFHVGRPFCRTHILSFLLISLSLASLGQTGPIRFRNLGPEDGLQDGSINAILQNRQGFFWFGTENGLIRYDGHDFRMFDNTFSEDQGLEENYVYCLAEDGEGLLWIGTFGGGIQVLDPYRERFFDLSFTGLGTRPKTIRDIHIDPKQNVWIASHEGLFVLHPVEARGDEQTFGEKFSYHHILLPLEGIKEPSVTDILQTKQGHIWVSIFDNRLWEIEGIRGDWPIEDGEIEANIISQLPRKNDPNWQSAKIVYSSYIDSRGTQWVATAQMLIQLDKKGFVQKTYWRDINDPNSLSSSYIRCIAEDKQGKLWLGTRKGINILNPRTGIITHVQQVEESLSQSVIEEVQCLYKDAYNSMWVGTAGGGLNMYDPYSFKFPTWQHNDQTGQGPSDNIVRCFFEDSQGQVWIGTENGLDVWNPRKRSFQHIHHDPNDKSSLPFNTIESIFEDVAGNMWIGVKAHGFSVRYKGQQGFTHFTYEQGNLNSLNNNDVYFIYEDPELPGVLWMGTGKGLNKFDTRTGRFTHFEHKRNDPKSISKNSLTSSFVKDPDGRYWVGTYRGGLNRFDPKTETFEVFLNDKSDPHSLSNNTIKELFIDQEGVLWVGTEGGLNRFDRATQQFIHYGRQAGLPGENVSGIFTIGDHSFLLSTENGLAAFDKQKGKITKTYDVSDGLLENGTTFSGQYQGPSGKIYLGTKRGMHAFHFQDIQDHPFPPKAAITDFQVFNRSVPILSRGEVPQDQEFALAKPIHSLQEITLSHREQVIMLDFAGMHYARPEANRFRYKLSEVDPEWVEVSAERRFATYTSLDPGHYTFQLYAQNCDGMEQATPTELQIFVKPHPLRSVWAMIIYGILIGLIAIFWRKQLMRRVVLDKEREMLEEMNQTKSRFFANISHEFRTPLTLILGPVENLLKNTQHESRSFGTLKNIQRESQRILHLINQLLDLSRLEGGQMILLPQSYDLGSYFEDLVASFHEKAIIDNKTFETELPNGLTGNIDPKHVEKIVYNLLSNAFKFTAPGGKIDFRVHPVTDQKSGRKGIFMQVKDTGTGIPKEFVDKIFDNFYQVDNTLVKASGKYTIGSGIGLALTQDLIELHGGHISVKSEEGKGSLFSLFLATDFESKGGIQTEEHRNTEEVGIIEQAPVLNKEPRIKDEKLPWVLVVDDKPELLSFNADQLSPSYNILLAENGKEALEIAFGQLPDLVVTDVKMPEMDGITFCKKLKADVRTSHIPVVMLTGKGESINVVEGLEAGAISYIKKPYLPEELQNQVRNILTLQEQVKDNLSHNVLPEPQRKKEEAKMVKINLSYLDEQFITRVKTLLEANYKNEAFNVNQMSSHLNMSRMQLSRKFNGLFGKPAGDFLRAFRLEKAAYLLADPDYNVSEVAYNCGFKSTTSFGKVFKNHFAKTPTQFRKSPPEKYRKMGEA